MISLNLLRIWHGLAMLAAVGILTLLLQYYGRARFSKQRVDPSDEGS